jgi:hypothetical protein
MESSSNSQGNDANPNEKFPLSTISWMLRFHSFSGERCLSTKICVRIRFAHRFLWTNRIPFCPPTDKMARLDRQAAGERSRRIERAGDRFSSARAAARRVSPVAGLIEAGNLRSGITDPGYRVDVPTIQQGRMTDPTLSGGMPIPRPTEAGDSLLPCACPASPRNAAIPSGDCASNGGWGQPPSLRLPCPPKERRYP